MLQESQPNWKASRIDHLEMPPSTVLFLVHQQHQDVAQDLQDNAEVHCVQPEHQVLGEIMLQLTNSKQQRKEDNLYVPQKDTSLVRSSFLINGMNVVIMS